jgi:NADH-quinone oxidoreductase subunit N
MMALAGLPGLSGFIGKLFLIEAAVDADYTWLGVAIAIGTMISLVYYLRVVVWVWMRGEDEAPEVAPATGALPAIAGGSPEADALVAERPTPTGARCPVILGMTGIAAAATVFFGIIPSPLVDWASNAGAALFSVIP